MAERRASLLSLRDLPLDEVPWETEGARPRITGLPDPRFTDDLICQTWDTTRDRERKRAVRMATKQLDWGSSSQGGDQGADSGGQDDTAGQRDGSAAGQGAGATPAPAPTPTPPSNIDMLTDDH